MRRLALVLMLGHAGILVAASPSSLPAWQLQARRVTITRDQWGIPHVTAQTDADSVFGVIYAQAEDDFPRIERNYLAALGRLAEDEGESALYSDLRSRLFVEPADLRARYDASPRWLKKLMRAWADGLNFYLATHPAAKPHVLDHFEPWMALSFPEGSIDTDVGSISLEDLQAFYGKKPSPPRAAVELHMAAEPAGSNGFAISPANTKSKRALLLINPHTTFYFRSEAQVTSEEGLNAYGAVTWGQFFVYQGFNDRIAWVHTSSDVVDAIDEYLETITRHGRHYAYRYGGKERPVTSKHVTLRYRMGQGMARRTFTVYATHHGPVIRAQDGKWVTVRLLYDPVQTLIQSFRRTKARSYQEFRQILDLHTNSSNNTVFASADGDIAYFHANFIPKRNLRFDWTKPVDGSDPATEWQGVHTVDESPQVRNPSTGWIQNTNDSPTFAAGSDSPKRESFPAYMDNGIEGARGIHAVRLLSARRDFDLDSLVALAYDTELTAFEVMIPALLEAYDRADPNDPLSAKLAQQIALLRAWDFRSSVHSTATTLAIYWGEELATRVKSVEELGGLPFYRHAARMPPQTLLEALAAASATLEASFGSWQTPWGDVNRFQRLSGDVVQRVDDAGVSTPVGFASGFWGSLPVFKRGAYDNSKKRYGNFGNTFVAVVELGDRVRARAVSAGGESGNPRSRHFSDQVERYVAGDLREVYFYPDQLVGHTERTYHPGS